MSDGVCILFSLASMCSDFNKENIFDEPWFADSTWTDFQAVFFLTSCQQKSPLFRLPVWHVFVRRPTMHQLKAVATMVDML